MKTFTLLVLLVAITTSSFTQIRKGQFIIGGNINFESTKSESSINPTSVSNNFFLSPNIGYFIINKMATGLRIDVRSYNFKTQNLQTHQINTSLSPFLRYYFLPISKKVNVYIDASYIHNKSKWSSDSNPGYFEKAKGYYLSVGPSIFLTNQIALEFTLGYRHSKSDNFGETRENRFNNGFGLQIHF